MHRPAPITAGMRRLAYAAAPGSHASIQSARTRAIPGRRALAGLACACGLAAMFGAVSGGVARAEGSSSSSAPPTAVLARLSNLRTSSEWAYPVAPAAARAQPSAHARVVGALHFFTGDDQAELYLALASDTLPSGKTWIQLEIPGRPNGLIGWVPRGDLGALEVVHDYLLINRRTLRATLFSDGRAVFSAPVGVGKASTITPAGRFYVLEKLTTLADPFYGPYAIGTSAYAPTLSEWPGGGEVGIHGTNEPELIPGRPSHGCIRMRNGDITRLFQLIPLGTPIEIV